MLPPPPRPTLLPYTTLFRSFWVANARPLGLAWFQQLPANLMEELRRGEWRQLLPVHWQWPGIEALAGVSLMVAALGLLRSEEHTSELQSRGQLVCRLLRDKR